MTDDKAIEVFFWLAIVVGFVSLLVIGELSRRMWLLFRDDIRASIDAFRHKPPPELPPNVIPLITHDKRKFLQGCEKWQVMHRPVERLRDR